MEGLEMQGELFPPSITETEDLCDSLLSRFSNSTREDHQRLCAVVGAMSQELKDHKLPLSPIAFFGATVSSLNRLSSDSSASDPVIPALLTLLSMILPKISPAVLRSRGSSFVEPIFRILGFGSASVAAVKAGLKCISHLIIVSDKVSWSNAAPSYEILLRFVTDHRPKVRKQSHSCLCDVLQSFQGSAVLASASEGLTNIFERFLLLAGGSNPTGTSASEGPKGATEVLYILSALKECLPLMSIKFISNILKYFKSLLELRQPIVTKHIVDILHALCSSPTTEVAPEVLLDLLCTLASSVSVREKSADEMKFMACLLDVGSEKVFALNRQICVVKLPIMFNALGEILASEHEEATFAATEALKGLIRTCLDESLIQQGADQIRLSPEGGERRSGPTIIEKICATIESLLGYQYSAVWDMSFQVLSTMFDRLGESSSYLMRGAIKSLAEMQNLPDEDLIYRKQLHDCIGSALGAVGPEKFLSLLPLNLDAEDLSDANIWLLPILKHYTVGAHLSFFTKSILGLVGLLRQKSQMLEKEGRIFSSRSTEALVYSLWSLLPAFCNYPLDTANTFKVLEKTLRNTLREEPELRGIICTSLQILIQQNKRVLAAENSDLLDNEIRIPEQRARKYYTSQVAADNLNVIKSLSSEFVSVLSGIFFRSSKDSGGYLQSTISEFASISDKKVVKRLFTTTMQKLLKVTQEAVNADQPRKSSSMQIDGSAVESPPSLGRAQLLDLAVSLLPGLDTKEVDLLFIAIKPALQDEDGLVQKKAYKILSIILKERDEFLSSKLDDLLELMIEVLPSCHFSAKRHRLDSLYFLIVHVSKDASEQKKRDIISSYLTEIILSLKESNKKTRNRAYDLIVKIGHACGDEDQGGKKENLQQFFNMVAGGLAGETPHMISAAVKGLARLAYEFSDLIATAYNLLPSAFLLQQRKNREINKANLGLMKVLVAKSHAEGLQVHLRSMVEGILKWQDDTKNHFKAKIKILLEMLVKKCGLDSVKAVMPEEHMKLLTNIRKTKERKERRVAAKSEESGSVFSKASTSRLSRWNHTNIFSDFGDEDANDDSDADHMEAMTVTGRQSKTATVFNSKASSLRSMRTRRATKSLPEELFEKLEEDPLDLLDRQKTRSALQSSNHLKRKPESDDEPEIDSEGRLVIREDGKPKKKAPVDHDNDTKSQTRSINSVTKAHKKRQKTSDSSGWAYTGGEYTSKKASGDLKRKDKLEPYAYWPLDRKMLNRREEHRATARKGMASVMKLTKKLEGKSASSALLSRGLKIKKKQKGSKRKGR